MKDCPSYYDKNSLISKKFMIELSNRDELQKNFHNESFESKIIL